MSTTQISLVIAGLLCSGILGYCIARSRSKRETIVRSSFARSRQDSINPEAIYICPLSKESAQRLVPITLDGGAISRLSAILQQVPGIGVNSAAAAGQFYELSFSPAVTKALNGGGLKLMDSMQGGIRANAVSRTGVIAGQGTLHPAEFLKTAAAAAAVWQVLSVAVAQKHLADIQQQLQVIASRVRGIQKWLHNDQQGKLEGNLQYLSGIAACFLEGHLSEQDLLPCRSQLDQIDRETTQIARALELEFGQLQSKLPAIELNEWFGTKHDTETILAEIREHERLAKAWLLAMHVRAAACQLSCALPGERHIAERRLADIRAALNGCASWKASTPLFHDLIEKRLDSPWNLKSTLDERRKQLKTEVDSLDDWVARSEIQISDTLGRIRNGIGNAENSAGLPLRIAVEVDAAGTVIGVSRVVEE